MKKLIIVFMLIFFNNEICKADYHHDMPLSNVFSSEITAYYDANDSGIAFIDKNDNLFIETMITDNNAIKKDVNIRSIKAFINGGTVFELRKDKSVWVRRGIAEDAYPAEKILDNINIIESGKYGQILYMLKEDNSLWVYSHGDKTYGDGLYRKRQENGEIVKIMDDVAYIRMTPISKGTIAILKTDGTLWQNDVETINLPQKITNDVVSFDVNEEALSALKKDGTLYTWNYRNIKNKNDIIKVTDNVKHARSFSDESVYYLENNGTLWETNYKYGKSHLSSKVTNNVKYMIGDDSIYFINNDGKVFQDIFGELYYDDYNIKLPEYNKKEEIILAKEELENYIKITKNINMNKKNITNELNNAVSKMLKENAFSKEEKENIDNKIKEYEKYEEDNKNKLIINASDAGKNGLKIYTNEIEKDIFYNDKSILNELKENKYNIEDDSYIKARRYYAMNAICYTNDWRNLSSYSIDLFTNENVIKKVDSYKFDIFCDTIKLLNLNVNFFEPIIKNIDGMEITKTKNIYNINLNNVKSYEILNPSEETYGYYLLKIVTNNNNTYIITGFNDDVDYYNGYIYPTGNGIAIKQGSMGNHIFVIDTSEIKNSIDGEMYSLNDILSMYIKQDKTDWNYKDVNVSRGKNNEYIMKIKNAELIEGKGSSYINKWLYNEKGEFLKQLTSSCFKVTGKNTKYMYSMNDLNILDYEVVEDKEKINKSYYSNLELYKVRDLNDYNGVINYYIKDEKVYIKHKDKNIIIMSE